MWIRASGQLSDNVYQINTSVSSHMLVADESAAIIDCGPSAVHARLIEELERHIPGAEGFAYVFLTHAHFDHIGGMPYVRRWAGDTKLVVGPQTAELLAKNDFREELFERNERLAKGLGTELEFSREEWCAALEPDRILGDGDMLKLGDDVEVKLIACPGHTEDCVGYYVKPDGAFACGEAVGGYAGRDKVSPCFLSGYRDYLQSLVRLSALDMKFLALPHGGTLSGELITRFLMDAQKEALRFFSSVKERLDQGVLVDEIYDSLLPEWQSENICPEGPFAEAQGELLKQQVQAAALAAVDA